MSGKQLLPIIFSGCLLASMAMNASAQNVTLDTEIGWGSDPLQRMQRSLRIRFGDQELSWQALCETSLPLDRASRTDMAMMALCRKPELASALHNYRAIETRWGQASSAHLPSFQFTASDQRRKDPDIQVDSNRPELNVLGDNETIRRRGLSVNWTVSTFGARDARSAHAQLQVQAAWLGLETTIDNTLLEVFTAYAQWAGAQQVAKVLTASLEQAQASVSMATERYRLGVGSQADVLGAQGMFLRAQMDAQRASTDAELQRTLLGKAMGLNAQELESVHATFETDVSDWVAVDLNTLHTKLAQHREQLAANLAYKAAEQNVLAVSRDSNPTLSLNLGKGYYYNANRGQALYDTKENTAGLSFNLPLFAGFGPHYKTREAQYQSHAQLDAAEAIRDKLRANATQNQKVLSLEVQQSVMLQRYVQLAQANLHAMRERYLRGIGDITFVLNAERDLANAQADWARGITRHQLAFFKHQSDLGVLRELIR
jgi:outer membrane protein TolC